ncbi:MAG: hypothetical protein PHQ18_02460 [Patescibacteria group bacterium]|nr:hypothetical protein [Patescibacteria group bacterium]
MSETERRGFVPTVIKGGKKETQESSFRIYDQISELLKKIYDDEIIKTIQEKYWLNVHDVYGKELEIPNMEKMLKLSAYAEAELRQYFQSIFDKFPSLKLRVENLSLDNLVDDTVEDPRGFSKLTVTSYKSVKEYKDAQRKERLSSPDKFRIDPKAKKIVSDVSEIMSIVLEVQADLEKLRNLIIDKSTLDRRDYSEAVDDIIINYGFIGFYMKDLKEQLA